MTTGTKQNTPDLLSLLQRVESTTPGDREWARRCTRQQAVLLRLHLPSGQRPTDWKQIAKATGITVWCEPKLPVPSHLVLGGGHTVLLISAELRPEQQLRVCLRELKRLIDLTARLRIGADAFPEADYEAFADYFADLVLEEHGP